MKIVCKVKVRNALGLHTRPAAVIVKMLQTFKSAVSFVYKNETINARSIMSILMLAAKKNSQIEVITEGEDAEVTAKAIERAFEESFGEK